MLWLRQKFTVLIYLACVGATTAAAVHVVGQILPNSQPGEALPNRGTLWGRLANEDLSSLSPADQAIIQSEAYRLLESGGMPEPPGELTEEQYRTVSRNFEFLAEQMFRREAIDYAAVPADERDDYLNRRIAQLVRGLQLAAGPHPGAFDPQLMFAQSRRKTSSLRRFLQPRAAAVPSKVRRWIDRSPPGEATAMELLMHDLEQHDLRRLWPGAGFRRPS